MPSDNETSPPAREATPTAPSPADSRSEEGEARSDDESSNPTDVPPLSNEPNDTTTAAAPPLPNEAPPSQEADDGWSAEWDATHQAWYFYNRFTGVAQWDNPRVPTSTTAASGSSLTAKPAATSSSSSSSNPAAAAAPPPLPTATPATISQLNSVAGGYNPAIHGSWDPNAPYAQAYKTAEDGTLEQQPEAAVDPTALIAAIAEGGGGGEDDVVVDGEYAQNAAFNRRTGKFQLDEQNPERYSDANKSHRQMNAYFDVDRAANSHDGRSLKAERRGKQPTKKELAMWKEKRKARKEEKRRAWLRD